MINKIKLLLLSIFCLISLTNCSQNTKMYSFKDITGKDVKDIVDVSINHSKMSSIRDYE